MNAGGNAGAGGPGQHSRSRRWPRNVAEARAVQESLRDQLRCSDDLGPVHRVAGVDVGFERGGEVTRAAVAVLAYPSLTLLETAIARRKTRFPYIPGYLSFREVPALLAALERLATAPDLILCDGQGYAHPRRLGLACHLGLLTDIPTIGVAKSRLIGEHGELAPEKGAWVPLQDRGEVIGAVLRSRSGVRPLYISAGHRIGLESALHYVLQCTTRYRLPETTRHAHRLASGG